MDSLNNYDLDEKLMKLSTNPVTAPSYYIKGGMECMDAIKAAVSNLEGFEAYATGNVIKYMWRWKDKSGAEDLKKARKYINCVLGGDGMRVLVACEESQSVTIELRKLGHEAYSCDIEPCSGGHPEWHLHQDVIPLLLEKWDMVLAFPPCTYLTCTGNKWFKKEYRERFPTRESDREDAIRFFMEFANATAEKIAIENPIGIMSTRWRKPDQIIQPYQFGHTEKKSTCLWLKGLPKLNPTQIVEPKLYKTKSGKYEPQWHMDTMHLPKKERSMIRSKTFAGIAEAMARQWAG